MCAQVLLLIDKQAYDTQNEVVVYVPTSHVTGHQADMLSIQLLHDRFGNFLFLPPHSLPPTYLVLLARCLSLGRRGNTESRAVGTGGPRPGSSTPRT